RGDDCRRTRNQGTRFPDVPACRRAGENEKHKGNPDGRLEAEIDSDEPRADGGLLDRRVKMLVGPDNAREPEKHEDRGDGCASQHQWLKVWVNWARAGYSSTANIAGKMRITSGNRILIGAFC